MPLSRTFKKENNELNKTINYQIEKLRISGLKVKNVKDLIRILKQKSYNKLEAICTFAKLNQLSLEQKNILQLKTLNEELSRTIWEFIQNIEERLFAFIINLGEYYGYKIARIENDQVLENVEFQLLSDFESDNDKKNALKNRKHWEEKVKTIFNKHFCSDWPDLVSHMDMGQMITLIKIIDSNKLKEIDQFDFFRDDRETYLKNWENVNILRNVIAHHKILIVDKVDNSTRENAKNYVETKNLIESCEFFITRDFESFSKAKLLKILEEYKDKAAKNAQKKDKLPPEIISANFDAIKKTLGL